MDVILLSLALKFVANTNFLGKMFHKVRSCEGLQCAQQRTIDSKKAEKKEQAS